MLIHTLFLPFLCSTKPSLVIEYLSGQIQMTFTNENYDRLGLIFFFSVLLIWQILVVYIMKHVQIAKLLTSEKFTCDRETL